ncbi:ABC transporter permease [Streptomyces sp. NY05-11A]|uniref:ABC transporter permease n=1 Tax=Streptomyces soliscabiei TaxID=588897 RepID=UPI0029B3F175|nr:ABC transporter permease [Streptomyces sp. NY05-11A]MDX2678249.1 ABC transporter permease [Streptomyces sp. NY05-11A]
MVRTLKAGRGPRLRARVMLIGPGLSYLVVLLLLPLGLLIGYTLFRRGRFGRIAYEDGATGENFTRITDSLYAGVLTDSLRIAAVTTVLALLLGYPTAYAIARLPGRWRTVALVLVVLPFWTNFLIRTYAWIVLLSSKGVLNTALTGIGVIDRPLQLLYTEPAVVVGLLYAYLPLMVLPLYAAIERVDVRLLEASADLGARPARRFWSVTLPLTLPGALTGCVFVFVPSLGNFVVPELLGGGRTVMVGTLIRDQFLTARDWPFGSVLALALMALLVLLLMAQAWAGRRLGGR